MPPTRADLELAMLAYWRKRDQQGTAAQLLGSSAEGRARFVRGGGHFNALINLLARFFLDAGYPIESIGAGQRNPACRLPGYYRPTKDWDLVVVHRGVLVAAIELKALGGPSFGNNYNNRVEEALGNAVDLARANVASLVGPEQPWLGYVFVMEDHHGSRRAGRGNSTRHFPVDTCWERLSYQERFCLTGERLIDERHYDAVCYLVSSPDDPGPYEPSARLDWQHLCAAVQGRLTYLKTLGYP